MVGRPERVEPGLNPIPSCPIGEERYGRESVVGGNGRWNVPLSLSLVLVRFLLPSSSECYLLIILFPLDLFSIGDLLFETLNGDVESSLEAIWREKGKRTTDVFDRGIRQDRLTWQNMCSAATKKTQTV